MPLPSANLSFERVRAMVQSLSFFGAYCSKACSKAARRWTRWQAAQRYRASEKGKERRRQQSYRYRERVRQRQQAAQEQSAACEGHQEAASSEKIPCSRPGCYELFAPIAARRCRSSVAPCAAMRYVAFASVKRVGNRVPLLFGPQNDGNRFADRGSDSVSCRILKH